MSERILLVDDDPNVLSGYKRHLRKLFDVELAEGGRQALNAVEERGPFAVVVSDMQMPEINGVQLLSKIADTHPDTVRVMLTGNADQQTAVDAVNEGQIFRFLNKPCSPDQLATALKAGLRQYQLIRAEHDLLSKTLSGSVSLVTEVLSLANPLAFGRASRVRALARNICSRLNVPNAWQVEIAAMLSQTGCVSIPQPTLEKLFMGKQLSADEQEMVNRHPAVGADLVRKIPRLEGVADLIAQQDARLDVMNSNKADAAGFPLGARILKVVLDYDGLVAVSNPSDAIHTMLHERAGWYDPSVTEVLIELIDASVVTRSLKLSELRPGMILDEHAETRDGAILMAKGHEVSASLLTRLRNFAESPAGVRQPILVRCHDNKTAETAHAT